MAKSEKKLKIEQFSQHRVEHAIAVARKELLREPSSWVTKPKGA